LARLIVNVDVPNVAAAAEFYVAALGLSVGRRFGEAAVELLGAEAPIYLLAAAAGSSPFPCAAAPRGYVRHWTPIHLDFAVDDLDEAVERALRAGATLESPAGRHAWGRLAVLADPYGHGFCLLQFEGRGYDEVADPT
jgi:catechol 2,3-dioxygenase-like lactoylglutathione lyase family enzyme